MAAYLYLPRQEGDRSARVEKHGTGLLVDLSDDGRPIGIEIAIPSLVTVEAVNNILRSLRAGSNRRSRTSPPENSRLKQQSPLQRTAKDLHPQMVNEAGCSIRTTDRQTALSTLRKDGSPSLREFCALRTGVNHRCPLSENEKDSSSRTAPCWTLRSPKNETGVPMPTSSSVAAVTTWS